MDKELLCGYCGIRPLNNRKDAKTCGNPECLRQNDNYIKRKKRQIRKGRHKKDKLGFAEKEERLCLKCDQSFVSEGNRICPKCTESNRAISADMVYIG